MLVDNTSATARRGQARGSSSPTVRRYVILRHLLQSSLERHAGGKCAGGLCGETSARRDGCGMRRRGELTARAGSMVGGSRRRGSGLALTFALLVAQTLVGC